MSDTGRAGRMRLERRLRTARHGAELLDRTRQILTDELERLQLHTARLELEWADHADRAATWQERVAALDGQEAIRCTAPTAAAQVTVVWGGAMGATYPVDATFTAPQAPATGGSSALAHSAAAHREAAAAAARLAAARRAVVLVTARLESTRTRQRAVENRWIPRLEEQLQVLRRRLDEQELEESLRVRWAAAP
ncbi:V-type ATP synthase subunit D [Cellulomonas soli]|uniref:V-type ATP synthase subunit D n=1 Tax=Cellulomonas soli TaxID=931535 RepID=UPI003F84C019